MKEYIKNIAAVGLITLAAISDVGFYCLGKDSQLRRVDLAVVEYLCNGKDSCPDDFEFRLERNNSTLDAVIKYADGRTERYKLSN